MMIDFGVITKLSGLLKAITYTIRVIFRPGLKLSQSWINCHGSVILLTVMVCSYLSPVMGFANLKVTQIS